MSAERFGCYVGNIDRSVPLEMLKQIFSQCGTIIDCSLKGGDDAPFRYGFIDFATEDGRQKALKFDGLPVKDRKLKVGKSKGNANGMDGPNRRNNPNQQNNMNDIGGNPMSNPLLAGGPNAIPPGMNPNFAGLSPAQMMQLAQMLQGGPPPPGQPPYGGVMGGPPTPPAAMAPMNMNYGQPSMQPGWGGPAPMGGFYPPMGPPHGGHRMGGPQFVRAPANPPPSAETLKLREKQRGEFFDVVRKDAEKYQKKMAEKAAKSKKEDTQISSEDEDSSDDETQQDKKRTKTESPIEDPTVK